jgi:hypothetical protein
MPRDMTLAIVVVNDEEEVVDARAPSSPRPFRIIVVVFVATFTVVFFVMVAITMRVKLEHPLYLHGESVRLT